MKKRFIVCVVFLAVFVVGILSTGNFMIGTWLDWYADIYDRPVAGLLFFPWYLYLVVKEIEMTYTANVIVRIKRKTELLRMLFYKCFAVAFWFAVSTNGLCTIIPFVFARECPSSKEAGIWFISLLVSHTLLWFVLGGLYVIILLKTDRIIVSSIVVLLVFNILLFGRQSHLYSLRNVFPDVFEYMLMGKNDDVKKTVIQLSCVMLVELFVALAAKRIINRKGFYQGYDNTGES